MLDGIRARLSYANVMASVAVFIALSGTSYAAAKITGADVLYGSLTGNDVKNSSLTGKDVEDSSLSGRDIVGSSVDTTDIADGTLMSRDFKAGELPGGTPEPAVGPRGPDGEDGEDGAQGTRGPAGADGGDGGDGDDGDDGAAGTGLTSGRINDVAVNAPPQQTFYGYPVGVTNGAPGEVAVQTLSPNVPTSARNLAVRLTLFPCDDALASSTLCYVGGSVDIALRVDGADSALHCVISTPSTTCSSGTSVALIPPASRLSIVIRGDLLGVAGHPDYDRDMLFGFQMNATG